jgi:hypothetical protein
VACLAAAAVHLARLVLLGADQRTDRLGEAAHVVMGVGMAAMFAPAADPIPVPVWVALFAIIGVWFGAVAVRVGDWTGSATHHAVGGAAMLLMLLGGHDHAAAADGEHAGHAAHGGSVAGFGWTTVASVLLAGYFVWHLWRVLDTRRTTPSRDAEPPAATGPIATATVVRTRPSLRTALLSTEAVRAALVVMSGAMAAMLLGLV